MLMRNGYVLLHLYVNLCMWCLNDVQKMMCKYNHLHTRKGVKIIQTPLNQKGYSTMSYIVLHLLLGPIKNLYFSKFL